MTPTNPPESREAKKIERLAADLQNPDAPLRETAMELAALARRLLAERDAMVEEALDARKTLQEEVGRIASLEHDLTLARDTQDGAYVRDLLARIEALERELQEKHIIAGTRIESYGQGRRAGEANMEKALAEIERLRCADYTAIIEGALKSTIDAHGPITGEFIASARRRIQHGIREARKP